VRKAINLRLDPPKDGKQLLDGWLALIKDESFSGYATDYLYDELIASTPAELRTYAVEQIRKTVQDNPDALRQIMVMKALGAQPTPKEESLLKTWWRQ
jgi:hypothetical protein